MGAGDLGLTFVRNKGGKTLLKGRYAYAFIAQLPPKIAIQLETLQVPDFQES